MGCEPATNDESTNRTTFARAVTAPRLTAGCLFSGMGGFASGLTRAGFAISWANDNNEYACRTFRHRFPLVRFVAKDARTLSVHSDGLAEVDVLVAGFPCQSFSQAGDRRGFQDSRGGLFFEIPRLIKEFGPERRPLLVILENVPHLQHGADGTWFDEVQRALRQAGYWFRRESCWAVNVKDATELPQDRERLFMVAASRTHFSRNPFLANEATYSSSGSCRSLDAFIDRTKPAATEEYLPRDNRYYKMIASAMEAGKDDMNIYQLRRSYVREKKHGLCPTLTANMGIGGHNVPFIRDEWGIRRLSVEEVARLQGFDSEDEAQIFPDIPTVEQYRLLGNSVCVHLACLVGKICAGILNRKAIRNV